MNLSKQNQKILKPTEDPLEIEGRMSYAESQRAWGTIRLKSEIFNEFKQLKNRRDKFGYKLMFCREFEQLEKEIRKIKKEIGVPPLLVWFVRE
ncbi:hypothetical protein KAI32_03295 [Candidatus Pacearchaeota archaeon]|nr:hypothetical protein [Candidatus Pacearchaeota archaeon]